MTGIAWYVGIPGSGKTTLAAAHLWDLVAETGRPALVIDTERVENFAHVPHVPTLAALERAVWGERSSAAWEPRDPADFDRAMELVRARGNVVLLIDEAAAWINRHTPPGANVLRVLRGHRHARVHVLLTTQHLTADVPQSALSCSPTLYVFRCEAPAVLEVLEKRYGIDPESVAFLEQFEFFRYQAGFSA